MMSTDEMLKERVLQLLEDSDRYTAKDLAAALDSDEKTVADIIRDCERDGTILGYKAVVDWEKTKREYVTAYIQISVVPHKGEGFDHVAQKICAFPEVQSLYLMSGGYDLGVTIEGKTMKEVARFVFDELAAVDGVTATSTHFVLTKYKDKGIYFGSDNEDRRENLEI